MEEINFRNTVWEFYKTKNWRDILKLSDSSNNYNALKLLWVWPEEKNLIFIKKIINDLGCQGISSIGCGCGLLEWIISDATGVPVKGYEVNREWWESKYSNPQFIDLNYVTDLNDEILNPSFALLFCYFNDREAFQNYIKNYRGNVVIIIGPGKSNPRHTDPEPFTADFGDEDWCLYTLQGVRSTGDYIAVYTREI